MMVVAVLLIPVTYSYVSALTGPGNDSMQSRSVEWAREHHLGFAVDRVEKYWYAHHQAKIGGTPTAAVDQLNVAAKQRVSPALAPGSASSRMSPDAGTSSALPAPAPSAPTSQAVAIAVSPWVPTSGPSSAGASIANGAGSAPPPLVSPAQDPIAGEGQWTGIGPVVNGRYGAYGTLIRPDAVHTSILDAVVRIDPRVLSFRQYPGLKIPGAPWDRPAYIEPQRRASLVAAFNGGFRLADSRGGMFLGGTLLQPLRTGGATFVIDHNGVPNVGMWGRDFSSTDQLDSARQNLDLIVDGGVAAANLATDANRSWGFTGPANRDAVWRSGAGVTADGTLIWVTGNGLTIASLADTLVRAGAVRAMQMDINQEWVQFITYAADATGVVHGRKLLSGMGHSSDRYLTTDTRDFIAVFTR